MTMQTKTIGRMPTDHGPYDPQLAYGKKFQCTLFGCAWESLHDNNNTAPAVWDGGDTITPNLVDWKKVSGSYEAWLMNKDKPATTGTTGAYPYNGMGRVVLKKHIVDGVNTLTHEAFEDSEGNDRENTIYVIQYDFTLGEDITVPANCVLEFDGGSINNRNITLRDGCQIVNGIFNNFGRIECGNNIIIQNTTIDSKTANLGAVYAYDKENIYIYNSNIKVDNNEDVNPNTKWSPVYFERCTNVRFVETKFDGGRTKDASIEESGGCHILFCSDVLVDHCICKNTLGEGIYFVKSDEIVVSNCICFDVLNSGIATSDGTNISVLNNHCYNTGWSCISINAKYVTVCGNIVHDNERGNGITLGHSETGTIHGESIDQKTVDVVCSDNVIYNINGVNSSNGIHVTDPQRVVIANNIIKNIRLNGIATTGDTSFEGTLDLNFHDNIIETCNRGVNLECQNSTNSKIVVHHNSVRDTVDLPTRENHGYCVFGNSTSKIYITDNYYGGGKFGIYTSGLEIYIKHNTIINCINSCIRCENQVSLVVDNNTLVGKNESSFVGVLRIDASSDPASNYIKIVNNALLNYKNEIVINLASGSLHATNTNILYVKNNKIYVTTNDRASLYSKKWINNLSGAAIVKKIIFDNTINDQYELYERVETDAELPSLLDVYNIGYKCVSNGVLKEWNGSAWV